MVKEPGCVKVLEHAHTSVPIDGRITKGLKSFNCEDVKIFYPS